MLNVCTVCKKYSVEKQISEDGRFIVCPFCGHMQEVKRMPLFIITGASSVGKSTVCAQLFLKEKDYIVMESDILWNNRFNDPESGYREYRELWLRLCKNISQIGKPVVLCGCAVPEQFENCRERRYFSELYYLSLVCENDVLYKRITENFKYEDQYVKDSIHFNTWLKENADKTNPKIQLLDNTNLTVDETVELIDKWIYKHLRDCE